MVRKENRVELRKLLTSDAFDDGMGEEVREAP